MKDILLLIYKDIIVPIAVGFFTAYVIISIVNIIIGIK